MEKSSPEEFSEASRMIPLRRPRIQRAPIACEYCHRRKIRCDVMHGVPCTNCRLDRVGCQKRAAKVPTGAPRGRVPPRRSAPRAQKSPTSPVHFSIPVASSETSEANTAETESQNNDDTHTKFNVLFCYYPFLDSSRLARVKECDAVFLEAQGCFHLPPAPVLDSLVNHYFLYVHPCLPLINESEFWHMYRHPDESKGQFSLLLFQAILFAAAPFVPSNIVEQSGFSSPVALRDEFYKKANMLYIHGIEDDHFVLAQAAILLSSYNSNTDAISNSKWLTAAVRHAEAENAHSYDFCLLVSVRDRVRLKRLWWCCIIRDRLISLGTRRPIQILPSQYPLADNTLSLNDLQDDMDNSGVYQPDIRLALNWALVKLAGFVVAVTDLLVIAYPSPDDSTWGNTPTKGDYWETLEEVRSRIEIWEADFMKWVQSVDSHVYLSVTVFLHLTTVYHQSARMALCNLACRLAAESESPQARITLGYYKAELHDAVCNMTDKVQRLIRSGKAKYLPVSAMACTVLPLILWQLNVGLSSTPAAKRRNTQNLSVYEEINRLYGMRYDIRRVDALIQQVLEFVKPEIVKMVMGTDTDLPTVSFPDMFEKEPQSYASLCLYLDGLLSADDKIKEANTQKFIRIMQLQFQQLQEKTQYSSESITEVNTREPNTGFLEDLDVVSCMLRSSDVGDCSVLSPILPVDQIETRIENAEEDTGHSMMPIAHSIETGQPMSDCWVDLFTILGE